MFYSFFFLFSIAFFSVGNAFCLKDRIKNATPGDYIVAEANKTITILCIREANNQTVILEEISVPVQSLKKYPSSWADWVLNKAPGHTSWSMVEIDLSRSELLECYSFTKSAWIQLAQNQNLFTTLLKLQMKKVSPNERRKIGPPPMEGEPDFRKTWTPPLIFEGKKVTGAEYDVYDTTWPKDNSELSGEEVTLYFDQNRLFPLPFWVQVNTSHVTASLRTIDSGKNLPKIYQKLPRRVPEFVGLPSKTENSLSLNLKSPKYYREFDLFAVDVTNAKKQIFPIAHLLKEGEDEWKTVEIRIEELERSLEPKHSYTWLIVPVGYNESYTETRKPFIWMPEK